VLATAGVVGSECIYDMGLCYAGDGYGSGNYGCDPFSPFDSYYDCDNGYGYSNIGYGGGWYDNYGRRYKSATIKGGTGVKAP
jgi:hypothetical protein